MSWNRGSACNRRQNKGVVATSICQGNSKVTVSSPRNTLCITSSRFSSFIVRVVIPYPDIITLVQHFLQNLLVRSRGRSVIILKIYRRELSQGGLPLGSIRIIKHASFRFTITAVFSAAALIIQSFLSAPKI